MKKVIDAIFDFFGSIAEAVLCPDIAQEKYGIEHWQKPNLWDAQ